MNTGKSKSDGFFSRCFIVILYTVSVYGSYLIPFYTQWPSPYDHRNMVAYLEIVPFLIPLSLLIIAFNDGFDFTLQTSKGIYARSFASSVLIALAATTIAFFQRGFALPRSIILQSAVFQFILIVIIHHLITHFIAKNSCINRKLFIGSEFDRIPLMHAALSAHIIDNGHYEFLTYDSPTIANVLLDADEVYLTSDVPPQQIDDMLRFCISSGRTLYLIPKTYEIAIYKATLLHMDDIPLFRIDSLSPTIEKKIIKRSFDLCISIIAIIVLSPLMLVTAMMIKLQDGGPILYSQERVTQNNHVFRIWKFRSMVLDAERHTGPTLSINNDPRITLVGRFLRKYWLDELPQLFNVVRGDMSLVGPRPERPEFIDSFSRDIPHFTYRLAVKAGVTGLAQVMGRYATTPEHKIKYDLIYIRNMSLFYDVKIILSTLKMILFRSVERTKLPQSEDFL